MVLSWNHMSKLYAVTCSLSTSLPLLFPVMSQMKDKSQFNATLYKVSASVTFAVLTVCILVNKMMGNDIEKIQIVALLKDHPIIRLLLCLFSISLLLNMSYMAYPAYKIIVLENKLFSNLFEVNFKHF